MHIGGKVSEKILINIDVSFDSLLPHFEPVWTDEINSYLYYFTTFVYFTSNFYISHKQSKNFQRFLIHHKHIIQ